MKIDNFSKAINILTSYKNHAKESYKYYYDKVTDKTQPEDKKVQYASKMIEMHTMYSELESILNDILSSTNRSEETED